MAIYQYKVVSLEKLPGAKISGGVGGPFMLGAEEKPLEAFLNDQAEQEWRLSAVLLCRFVCEPGARSGDS